MTPQAQLLGTMDALLGGYASMRQLVVKMAAERKAPEVVLEKVASVPQRATADKAVSAVDALVKRGFVGLAERESMIRSLCTSSPDAICDVIEKFAGMAIPLETNFDHRFEDRGGVPTPSEYSSRSNQAWLGAAGVTRNQTKPLN